MLTTKKLAPLCRMFELPTSIPVAKDLHVSIMDFDLVSADDLIGETTIDLENRLLSKHRATVGLPQSYCTSGVCRWRDSKLPTQILAEFCEKHLDTAPVYADDETVEINSETYTLADLGQQLLVTAAAAAVVVVVVVVVVISVIVKVL